MATGNSMKWALIIAYVLILLLGAAVGVMYARVTAIDAKGHALREWATTIPRWAKHTEGHDHTSPPPIDHVQPPPDPPPFW
jgi:hypothetical protein